MPRVIPEPLEQHLQQRVTTTSLLLKILLPDGTVTGMTTHDQPLDYDGVTYGATDGFDPSVIATDSGYDVDNAEGYALLSGSLPGITEEMVQRGELEGATWEMRLVNYADLSQGHILLDVGDLGEVKLVDGMVWIPELLSYMMRLRQTIGHVDSKTCRAIFGNLEQGQLYCGVDANALWVLGTVSSVDDAEPKRRFTGDASQEPPARLQWTTGNNASDKLYQLEETDSNGEMAIFEPLPFPIEAGDEYQIRPDCGKSLATCRDTYDNLLEFKGEPLIPVGEASETPGANLPNWGNLF